MLDAIALDALNTLLSIVCGFLGNAFFHVRGQSSEQTKHTSEDLTQAHEEFTREMQKVIPEVAQKLRQGGKLHPQDTERLMEFFWRDASQGRQVFERTLESMLVGELSALPVGEDEEQATDYWGVYSTGHIKDALKQAINQAGLKQQLDNEAIDRCLTPIIVELMKAVSRRPELSNLVIQRQLQLVAEALGHLIEQLGAPSDQTMAMVLHEYFTKQRRRRERDYSKRLAGENLSLVGNFEFIPPSLCKVRRINREVPTDLRV